MFAKPECVDVLQPEPRSGEGCNFAVRAATHYYTINWTNVKTQDKNVKSSLLYIYNRLNCVVVVFSKKRTGKRIKLKFIRELWR